MFTTDTKLDKIQSDDALHSPLLQIFDVIQSDVDLQSPLA